MNGFDESEIIRLHEKMMDDLGTALSSQVFKHSFSAFDCVSGEWFYSKDYESLAEFFSQFDNVQYVISLVKE